MDIAKYQVEAHRLDDNKKMLVSLLGLVGEAGGVQSALKKRLVTKRPWLTPTNELAEELGDFLWYLASVCSLAGLSMKQLALSLSGLTLNANGLLTFSELQHKLAEKEPLGKAKSVQALSQVAVEIQQLLSLQASTRIKAPGVPLSALTDLTDLAGETFVTLNQVATGFELNLDEIARNNLQKVSSLYEKGEVRRFDLKYPPDEQIPRLFTVQFTEEITRSKKRRVRLKIEGVIVGDTLTDNVAADDGYRFHDVFHLAFLANLGWSPVVRTLLRRKRKSNAAVDENEDGARAQIIEEAISLFLFQRRTKHSSYEELAHISHGILNTVRELARDLEVRICSAKEWQTAIHQGYATFKKLRKKRGGFVTVDLDNRHILFSSVAPKK